MFVFNLLKLVFIYVFIFFTLRYARANGCEWHPEVCAQAAANGHLNCLKYAHENGAPLPKNSNICLEAARGGHLECLKCALPPPPSIIFFFPLLFSRPVSPGYPFPSFPPSAHFYPYLLFFSSPSQIRARKWSYINPSNHFRGQPIHGLRKVRSCEWMRVGQAGMHRGCEQG